MITSPLFILDGLRRRWGWFLVLGILMLILGTIALIIAPAATLSTVLGLGWLIVFRGVIEAIHAFRMRKWGGIFLHLTPGILGVSIGLWGSLSD
jgi:uncharacterized membrane protein HdeD (DUF308 family)